MPEGGDPAETAAARDAIRLAFIAALQLLPPRQRAVLILRDVLRWHASEVASLLDTSVASVNSALQRAHATIDAADLDAPSAPPQDARQRDLLARYVAAFESYDVAALVDLLHEDATFCMPPFAMWLTGADQVAKWLVGQGAGCRGSRLVATAANGCAAFGSYKPAGAGRHDAWSIQVLEIHDGRITTWHNFLDTSLFPVFDLPLSLTG
jgi:RNA polymerase sigma-70 factor, ECF subfamily